MKWYQLRFQYGLRPVTFTLKARNYDDAVRRFTDKYGTWVGTRKEIMGSYSISEIKG